MTTEKEMLRRKTERHYMLVVFLNGVKNIRYDRRKRTIFLSAALAVLLLTAWLCQPGRYNLFERQVFSCLFFIDLIGAK